MDVERFSDIIAHFIGLFDAQTDEARLRQQYLDGSEAHRETHGNAADPVEPQAAFSSDYNLNDYSANLKYTGPDAETYDHLQNRIYDQTFHDSLKLLEDIAQAAPPSPLPEVTGYVPLGQDVWGLKETFNYRDAPPQVLSPYAGPGSEVGHILQANSVLDDDILDMTNGHHPVENLAYINEQLGELAAKAEALSPFSTWVRTDSPDGIERDVNDVHDFAKSVEQNGGINDPSPSGTTASGSGNEHYLVMASNNIDGIYVNGVLTTSAPSINDYLPHSLLANPASDPQGSDTPQHNEGGSGNSLVVETGGNVVANIAQVIDTNIAAPVMAVMGDFHTANVISQVFAYADHTTISGMLNDSATSVTSAQTVGKNIAIYAHTQFDVTATSNPASSALTTAMPNAWHVSLVNGDLSFVHWTEQYNFLSDNDSVTVTNTGVDTSVLTGANSVVNFASYLSTGQQYDLVVVGGHSYNLNSITQISVLYDNNKVNLDDNAGHTQISTGGNLIWNMASIENVGSADRFAAMPDYMNDVVKAIQNHDSDMPAGLSADANFAGYQGLNVLYITGNLYDVNVLKQVNVVSDADSITKVANQTIQDNPDATVKIDTGSNTVVNVASIVDYTGIGHTTYVAGNVYSDAVLIQAGLVDHAHTDATGHTGQPTNQLANEAIAFLDHDQSSSTPNDTSIETGHDAAYHAGAVGDVMQSVTG
jgi:hypothetical protein